MNYKGYELKYHYGNGVIGRCFKNGVCVWDTWKRDADQVRTEFIKWVDRQVSSFQVPDNYGAN